MKRGSKASMYPSQARGNLGLLGWVAQKLGAVARRLLPKITSTIEPYFPCSEPGNLVRDEAMMKNER